MNKAILIVGCGSIGRFHLLSILRSKKNFNILEKLVSISPTIFKSSMFVASAAMTLESFKEKIDPFLLQNNIDLSAKEDGDDILDAMRTIKPTLLGIAKDLKPYFHPIDFYDEKAVDKFLVGSESVLIHLEEKLKNLETWNEPSIDEVLSKAQSFLGIKTPNINQPIRIALTGSTQSPSLGLTLSLFDKAEALVRIGEALEHLKK